MSHRATELLELVAGQLAKDYYTNRKLNPWTPIVFSKSLQEKIMIWVRGNNPELEKELRRKWDPSAAPPKAVLRAMKIQQKEES